MLVARVIGNLGYKRKEPNSKELKQKRKTILCKLVSRPSDSWCFLPLHLHSELWPLKRSRFLTCPRQHQQSAGLNLLDRRRTGKGGFVNWFYPGQVLFPTHMLIRTRSHRASRKEQRPRAQPSLEFWERGLFLEQSRCFHSSICWPELSWRSMKLQESGSGKHLMWVKSKDQDTFLGEISEKLSTGWALLREGQTCPLSQHTQLPRGQW